MCKHSSTSEVMISMAPSGRILVMVLIQGPPGSNPLVTGSGRLWNPLFEKNSKYLPISVFYYRYLLTEYKLHTKFNL